MNYKVTLKEKNSLNCPLGVPHFDPVVIKKIHNNVTFQTMPPYVVHCAACAANKSLLSVSRHWTGCSCHCRFFALLARPKLFNSIDLLGYTDTIFFPNRPCPFHCYHPSLPSLCPLLVLYFLSWVCLTLPWSRGRAKLPTHSPSLWVSFLSLLLSLLVLCRVAAPWQHWQWKTCICLSCMLSLCCPFFSCSRWVSCRQGNRWLQERERHNCRKKIIKQYGEVTQWES